MSSSQIPPGLYGEIIFEHEECLGCGKHFAQWEELHEEYCALCRLADSIERIELILERVL